MTETKALKEWASVIYALDQGRQILLLRKGGVAETTNGFIIENRRFLLFPTYEHQKLTDIKPDDAALFQLSESQQPSLGTIRISHWAEVTHELAIQEANQLTTLSPYHIWTDTFVAMRMQFKPELPMQALFLRVYRLAQPTLLPMEDRYGGCRSWITFSQPVNLENSTPVLNEQLFEEKLKTILQGGIIA